MRTEWNETSLDEHLLLRITTCEAREFGLERKTSAKLALSKRADQYLVKALPKTKQAPRFRNACFA
jgi:hypothetical protein